MEGYGGAFLSKSKDYTSQTAAGTMHLAGRLPCTSPDAYHAPRRTLTSHAPPATPPPPPPPPPPATRHANHSASIRVIRAVRGLARRVPDQHPSASLNI